MLRYYGMEDTMRAASRFRWAAYTWCGVAVLCGVIAAMERGRSAGEWLVAGLVALGVATICERVTTGSRGR